ncbi:diphosphate--fructose-6-phosphate 1-phosphotransferase [Alkalicoccus urumqiensis]|uniref:Sulfofructose kinase n=1 Tax=Alkalicoccus urumqiensis TaxID=1548213 RepID=SQIK_ALKUR|nr:diphosphate--fructose-6-phosphate 1-phosphotransferase [Alkalicoccus urumqiensis]A0A2P6MHT4.1 RecName: Full=Sulfofructose kinase; Short=SF kinase [Alkalicoccus urumqiensis]PRO65852.1 hypothetical protein C6I21_08115 [Alkalicoccus urumqiensis]
MRVAIGQAGGPTSVINESLASFVSTFSDDDIYLVLNGYEGLATNQMKAMGEMQRETIERSRGEPGAVLGSGRYDFSPALQKQALAYLMERRIEALVFIGGNGTMSALHAVQHLAEEAGYPLKVIGIPKTVDNDIAGIDHAPGFGSAAKYVAQSARYSKMDLQAMRNFEQVRILETMGRNVGWLAQASGYGMTEEAGPDAIYVPEREYSLETILGDVRRAWKEKGYCLLVISEGVTINNQQTALSNSRGRTILGGVSKVIEEAVREKLELVSRAEQLGMNQRCYYPAVSKVDQQEAAAVGTYAAKLVQNGESGFMVGVHRHDTMNYKAELTRVPLQIVSDGGERLLPDTYIEERKAYNEWLEGIIDLPPVSTQTQAGSSSIL